MTKAPHLGQGKRLIISTDGLYAFATMHVHGAIYKERGLLPSEGKTVKNKPEILSLLQAVWLPEKAAAIHTALDTKRETEPSVEETPGGHDGSGGSIPSHHCPNGLAALEPDIHIA